MRHTAAENCSCAAWPQARSGSSTAALSGCRHRWRRSFRPGTSAGIGRTGRIRAHLAP